MLGLGLYKNQPRGGGASLPAGIFAHWAFDEGDPSEVIADSSGNGLTGDLSGPGWETIDGKLALHFDGGTDFVQITGSASTFNITGDLSIAFWMWPDDTPAGFEQAISKREAGVGPDTFSVELNVDTKVYLWWTTSGSFVGYVSTDTYTPGEWVHVAIVRNVATDELTIYLNGEDAGAVVASGTFAGSADTTIHDLTFGAPIYGGTAFDGSLREILIYERTLSQAEVQTIMQLTA